MKIYFYVLTKLYSDHQEMNDDDITYIFSINFQVTIDFPAFGLVKIHCL